MEKVKYSVIVGAYNEEETLNAFYDAIIPVMESTGESFEIIFVNDGSKDKTEEVARALIEKDKRIRLINFSRNYGQQAGFYCGFNNAHGEAIITMDADLQHPPATVLEMIDKWKQGYEVVHAVRAKQKGISWFKKWSSKAYAKFLRKITGIDTPNGACDFKLLDRRVVDIICQMKEHNRFNRNLTLIVGFKQTTVEFECGARVAGETKWTFKKLLKYSVNGVIPYSDYPLMLPLKAGIWGLSLSMIAFLTFIILAICKIHIIIGAWIIPVISTFFSILFVFMGINNMYLSHIYDEAKNRPIYTIRDRVNFDEE